jgi:hypothetical protein
MINSINNWNNFADIKWLTTRNENVQKILAPAVKLNYFEMASTVDDEKQKITKLDRASIIMKESNVNQLIIWIGDHIDLWMNYQMSKIYTRPNTVLICPNGCMNIDHIELVNECLVNPQIWQNKNIKKFYD